MQHWLRSADQLVRSSGTAAAVVAIAVAATAVVAAASVAVP